MAALVSQTAAIVGAQSMTKFVADGETITLADLMARFPASALYRGWYAHVSDLYGSLDEVLRCRFDGLFYRWVPQRDQYIQNSPIASGTIALTPMFMAPIVNLTANPTSNIMVVPSSQYAYLGQTFRVNQLGVLGVFGISISGLLGGGTVPLLSGSSKLMVFDVGGWRVIA
jgi:hypothetical protein